MLFIFCASFLGKSVERRIRVFSFGNAKYGEPINRYLLANERGTEAAIINYGADVVSWRVPDRDGKVADVVLGYDDLGGFEADKSCFGASIGRYGNRIAARQFTLDGSVFRLPKNDGPNCLHGRTRGFNKRVSTGVDASRPDAQVLELTYTSPDGDETVRAKVTFTLPVDKNELRIDYSATTDKDTVVNLTNHSYFNLTGVPAQAIADHQLLLRAARFTPVDATLIPTGEERAVAGSPFDFRKAVAIGAQICEDDQPLKFGKGCDPNWVLEDAANGGLPVAAEVYEPSRGRLLEVQTTEPGIQFYSGNFLDGTVKGKGGQSYGLRTGFCLETQHFPDSPKHANFPSTELKSGQSYKSTTVLRFSSRNEGRQNFSFIAAVFGVWPRTEKQKLDRVEPAVQVKAHNAVRGQRSRVHGAGTIA